MVLIGSLSNILTTSNLQFLTSRHWHKACRRRGSPHGPQPDAVFRFSVNQTCIVHLVRQSLRYLSWKERKSCASELRRIYTAADADAARQVLDELAATWAESKTRTADAYTEKRAGST